MFYLATTTAEDIIDKNSRGIYKQDIPVSMMLAFQPACTTK